MSKRTITVLCGLVSMVIVLAGCVQPNVETFSQSPLSPIKTPTPAMRATTSATALVTPSSTATLSPTSTPWPTLVPTLAVSALSSETIAAMAVWKEVDSDTGYTLYQITETPLGIVNLEWSPDGQNLWLNVATGPEQMGMVEATSLVVNRDTHNGWAAGQPGDYVPCSTAHGWSPDGSQLVQVRHDGQLWLTNVNGQTPRLLPMSPEIGITSPSYSHDGKMVAVVGSRIVSNSVHYDLWVVDVATGTSKRLIEDAGYGRFTWSPSENILAMRGAVDASAQYPIGVARLWIVDAVSGRTVFADLGSLAGTEGCEEPPTWLMGGKKVLATIMLKLGVWVVDLNGKVQRLDTQHLSDHTGRLPGMAAPLRAGGCDEAVASPDGRYVIHTVGGADMRVIDLYTNRSMALGQGDLCHGSWMVWGLPMVTWSPVRSHFLRWGNGLPVELLDATNGNVQRMVSSGFWPAWSPDGQQVIYWRSEADRYALWLLNLNDLKPIRLTVPSLDDPVHGIPFRYDVVPKWSPNGDFIAFVSYRGRHPEAYLLRLNK